MATYTLTVSTEAPKTITVTYPDNFDRYWTFRTSYKMTVRDSLKAMADERWKGWVDINYTDMMVLARFRKLEILLNELHCEPIEERCLCPRCN